MIASSTKNIKLTDKTHDSISINESPAAAIEFVILLSLIGSIMAAVILYTNEIKIILIIGYNIISIIMINPTELMAFFIINEYPATDAIASEKAFPTIGIKLSIANFAVFSVTASIVDEVIPLTVNSPINIVNIIPWNHIVICLVSLHKLLILFSVEILFANSNTKVTSIKGIITVV